MRILPAALLVAVFAPLGGAQDATDEAKLKDEIRALELKVAGCGLLRRLEITDDQTRTLLELAKTAAAAQADYDDKIAKIRQEQVKAFTEFRTEDIRNTGFTPKVEGAAAGAEHREIELRKKFCDRVAALEKDAPLTEEQRELLASIRPDNPATLAAVFERREAPLPAELGNFVRRLRRLADAEFERQKEDLRSEFARVIDARLRDAGDLAAALRQLEEALRKIRALADDCVNRDVPRIVRSARPKPKAERVREELGEIHKEHYGAIGPVGRFLLLPGVVEMLSKRLGVKVEGAPVVTGAAPS